MGLNLPNTEFCTGHCFRSPTLLVDHGEDITSLEMHGTWKSTTVAEWYKDDSINKKLDTEIKIMISGQNDTETQN